MKTFNELSSEQKLAAVNKAVKRLLTSICEGAMNFNDKLNGDDLQARIDAAWSKANQMQTPWFIGEYIMDTCRTEIEGMAQCDAEDSLYSEGENVIAGILPVA